MAKKKNTILPQSVKRPMCTFPGCKNKGRRIGKRVYMNTCEEHKPQYFAQ